MKKTLATVIAATIPILSLAEEKKESPLTYTQTKENSILTQKIDEKNYTTYIESKTDNDLVVDNLIYCRDGVKHTFDMHSLDTVMENPNRFITQVQRNYKHAMMIYAMKNPADKNKIGYNVKDIPLTIVQTD